MPCDRMQSMRRRHLPLLALAAVAGAAVPAIAFSEHQFPTTASFEAEDYDWHVAGGNATAVTVAKGATVTFSYPTGSSGHNADFTSGTPTSCTQTAGASSGSVPPLPNSPTGDGWAGNCTFDTPGIYRFVCDAHSSMRGTITVANEDGSLPTTTTGTTTTGTTTTTQQQRQPPRRRRPRRLPRPRRQEAEGRSCPTRFQAAPGRPRRGSPSPSRAASAARACAERSPGCPPAPASSSKRSRAAPPCGCAAPARSA